MTSFGGTNTSVLGPADLAAAVIAEEERRQSDAASRGDRDEASSSIDALLDAPFLPRVQPSTSRHVRLTTVRAGAGAARRIDSARRVSGAATAAVAAAVTLTGLLDRVAGTGGTPIWTVFVALAAALAGAVSGAHRPRGWTVRSTPRRLQEVAAAAAVAGLAAPMAVGLPVEVGQLLGVAVLLVLVRTGVTALVTASGLVPAELRAGTITAAALRSSALGTGCGAVLLLMVNGASDLRFALLGVSPVALLAAGFLASASAAVAADAVAAQRTGASAAHGSQASNGSPGPGATALEIRHLDFSYGHVQVLFDVSLQLHDGEVLALLGTNGAGKSTLLRAVSGLAPVDRGTIHHRGVDITNAEAGERVRAGIVQLPGGKAVFPSLTVLENLLAGGYLHIWDKATLTARIEKVAGIFPVLRDRLGQPAGTLSGGEQQMLAFAKALLLDPDILCIDELSLGLAPTVVQELLVIVEQLKAQALTMVIVEQSLNVALAIADRAVFMEKGRVRFDGPARELAERGDLARAVFLGGEGG